MVNFEELVDRLSGSGQLETNDKYIQSKGNEIVAEIQNGSLKIVDYVKGLNPILTNGAHEIRANGVKLLVHTVTQLPNDSLNEKEIEILTEFMCLRLIDHKSMEQPALKCLGYFLDCANKPARYGKRLVDFIKTKSNPHRMDARTRYRVYEVMKKVVVEKQRLSNVVDGDLIYSLVSIIENENNPDNLLLCFGLISYILKNFTELEPFLDDIFEWLARYYPVDYTPSDTDNSEAINIQREDLVEALYECFYATHSNADNLQTLLLEKVDSNNPVSKLESLENLIKCYEQFPLSSIQKYNSTLWTAIRMNCLRKVNTVDPLLMETSLRTLTALAKRLTEDSDQYFIFISDMYEELAIAFRKPEMDLFEPAAKLLTHAILPSIVGFNYVLDKILTIALNALEADELRPLPGLAYIFKHLNIHHPETKLKSDLNDLMKKLLIKVLNKIKPDDNNALTLVEALICHKVPMDEQDLNEVITKLRELNGKSNMDIEKCLAIVCLNYNRPDIICYEESADYQLSSLIKIVHSFESDELQSNELDASTSPFPTSLSKLSIYTRLLILQLDKCPGKQIDMIDQQILNQSLLRMRELASLLEEREIAERMAKIHAIIVNKLETQNVSKILMDIFSSEYCQKFVPSNDESCDKTTKVYLPLIRQVFKALVVRNHQLATPLINLFLNFITSDKVGLQLALEGSQAFSYVQTSDESLFNVANHYQVFTLYRQKFYSQSNKEIRIRYDKITGDETKKDLLLCTLAQQLPHLPFAVFRRDYDWLVRQLLVALLKHKQTIASTGSTGEATAAALNQSDQDLFNVLFNCLESLIQRELAEHLKSFLPSLIDLCLANAQAASTMQARRQALNCLMKIASSFSEAELLVFRPKVVDQLRCCLADKKRLVRMTAADARLRWVVIGQPIGAI